MIATDFSLLTILRACTIHTRHKIQQQRKNHFQRLFDQNIAECKMQTHTISYVFNIYFFLLRFYF